MLGILSLVLIVWGARVFQKQRLRMESGIEKLPEEDGPDDPRESLRKAIEQKPAKKEPRESSKRKAKHPEMLAEPHTSSLVPPGQIGSDSSGGEGLTPKSNRRPPIVTLKVPGKKSSK